jgi:DNA-binding protein HU-beta
MTKAELVNAIAISTGYDKTTISNIVEAGMAKIKETVTAGDSVYLRGFGSFTAKTRKAKIARNISKNISIEVPEHKIAYFKPADEFNNMVR